MKPDSISPDEKAAALLRVASYLGRPQQFMAIADARAKMRRTLELAAKGSVVLTTHGEPAAAVVPFHDPGRYAARVVTSARRGN